MKRAVVPVPDQRTQGGTVIDITSQTMQEILPIQSHIPLSYIAPPRYYQFETVRQHLHTSIAKDLPYREPYASDANTYQAHPHLEARVDLNQAKVRVDSVEA
jgi:hypothetical protein